MIWSDGYTAQFYAEILDADTWRGVQRIELTGGKITRSSDGLRGSADLDCRAVVGEKYVRVWMDARQGESGEHIALFTGLASQPDIEWAGIVPNRGLICYSVLKAADDVQLTRGWYAPAGIDAGTIIRNLLKTTPAPLVIQGEPPPLLHSIVAEDDESCLTMTDKVLTAIGWELRILGDGTILIAPPKDSWVQKFTAVDNDVIEPRVKVKNDWYSCPNVMQVIDDDLTATVRDENPNSFLSIPSRGREVWFTDSNADLNNNESIGQYAWRRLKEEQAVAYTVEYDRRYDPNVWVGDVVRIEYPSIGVSGNFRVKSQRVALGHNATTAEEVYAV